MIDRLRLLLVSSHPPGAIPIHARCADALEIEVERASVVVLNFTLQFVEPAARPVLLRKVCAGLQPGGVLLLSEKIRFECAAEDGLQTEWHHAFKRAQGYSELEIARKRDALERVMITDSLPEHRQRLQDAGFSRVYQWFQGFNFASLIAFR